LSKRRRYPAAVPWHRPPHLSRRPFGRAGVETNSGELLAKDPFKMQQEFVRTCTTQLDRLKCSGILKWEKDGLTFQKELRNEWQ
jgi:hypothetical protein